MKSLYITVSVLVLFFRIINSSAINSTEENFKGDSSMPDEIYINSVRTQLSIDSNPDSTLFQIEDSLNTPSPSFKNENLGESNDSKIELENNLLASISEVTNDHNTIIELLSQNREEAISMIQDDSEEKKELTNGKLSEEKSNKPHEFNMVNLKGPNSDKIWGIIPDILEPINLNRLKVNYEGQPLSFQEIQEFQVNFEQEEKEKKLEDLSSVPQVIKAPPHIPIENLPQVLPNSSLEEATPPLVTEVSNDVNDSVVLSSEILYNSQYKETSLQEPLQYIPIQKITDHAEYENFSKDKLDSNGLESFLRLQNEELFDSQELKEKELNKSQYQLKQNPKDKNQEAAKLNNKDSEIDQYTKIENEKVIFEVYKSYYEPEKLNFGSQISVKKQPEGFEEIKYDLSSKSTFYHNSTGEKEVSSLKKSTTNYSNEDLLRYRKNPSLLFLETDNSQISDFFDFTRSSALGRNEILSKNFLLNIVQTVFFFILLIY